MAWYKDWFDSPFYDVLYKKRDEEEAERLLSVISPFLPSSPARVADIACGRGRHSLNLAKQGYDVTGYDLSKRALQIAREKAKEAHLEIRFELHDMLLPIGDSYDAAVNLFTSFGYFADNNHNAKVFTNMADVLTKGGTLIVDFLNPSFVRRNLISESEFSTMGDFNVGVSRTLDNLRVEKKIDIVSQKKGDSYTFVEKVNLLEVSWFEKEAKQNDLDLVQVLGSYSGEDFDEVDSPRQIMIFTRI